MRLRVEFMSNLARTQREDSHEQMADAGDIVITSGAEEDELIL